jgi:hypothetical protein
MKVSLFKGLLIVVVIWAVMPWALWFVYQFHKPDHADAFWLPAMPLVFLSFVPMLLKHSVTGSESWFPIGWVVGSSAFNLAVGILFAFLVRSLRRRSDA